MMICRLFSELRISLARPFHAFIVVWLLSTTCIWPRCSLVSQTAKEHEFSELKADAEKFFRDEVAPFIKNYCLECHSNKRPTEAGVNFSPTLKNPGHAAFSQQWKKALSRVKTHDMPPEDAERQPTAAERQMFEDWLAKIKFLSPQDPGPFVIRRLTKSEYANTLRDLFGVEPAIADLLPDEVSGAGYLNSRRYSLNTIYLSPQKFWSRYCHRRVPSCRSSNSNCSVSHQRPRPALEQRHSCMRSGWRGAPIVDHPPQWNWTC